MDDEKKLMPLAKAVEAVTGVRPNLSTVLRWVKKGAKDIKLESVVLGGRYYTNVENVRRFISRTTEQAKKAEVDDLPNLPRVIPNRMTKIESAKAKFEKLLQQNQPKKKKA